MSHTRLFIVATIIAGIVIIAFLFSRPRATPGVAPATPPITTASVSLPSVALSDVFKKGVHMITGSVVAPDACTTVSAQATLVGDASSTQSILVDVSMPADTGVCLQERTTVSFSASIAAPAGAPMTVTVNGAAATTTAL